MESKRITDRSFFAVSAITLAPKLIGKYLCRKNDGTVLRFRITETESYIGEIDSACHAYNGRRTYSNRALYEEGGHIYVYICYGIHYLINITAGEKDKAEGVLIRSIECAKGPGNVTKKLNINKDLYLADLLTSNEIWVEDSTQVFEIKATKRIGLGKVRDEDRDRLWRFVAVTPKTNK